jgi:hypothetical protein
VVRRAGGKAVHVHRARLPGARGGGSAGAITVGLCKRMEQGRERL